MGVCLGLCISTTSTKCSDLSRVRDVKHISQSQEYEDTTNANEFSGGVGKGLAQNSTHYSVPTVPMQHTNNKAIKPQKTLNTPTKLYYKRDVDSNSQKHWNC